MSDSDFQARRQILQENLSGSVSYFDFKAILTLKLEGKQCEKI